MSDTAETWGLIDRAVAACRFAVGELMTLEESLASDEGEKRADALSGLGAEDSDLNAPPEEKGLDWAADALSYLESEDQPARYSKSGSCS